MFWLYEYIYNQSEVIQLKECSQIPSGLVSVSYSTSIFIHCYQEIEFESKCTPAVAYDNYVQGCLSFNRYGISHTQYMHKIIDELLIYNDNAIHTSNTEQIVAHQLRDTGANVKIKSVSHIPTGISGHLCDYYLDSGSSVSHDFDIVDKCRGFLKP